MKTNLGIKVDLSGKKNRKNYEYNEGNTELDKMICCETRETA